MRLHPETSPAMKSSTSRFLLAAAASLVVPILADEAARRLARKGYRAWTGENPPRNPGAAGVTWGEALVWTALAGALGGVARMATRKLLAEHRPGGGDQA